MSALNKPSTIYFDPEVHKTLKFKSLETSRSISDLVDEAVRHEFAMDEADLRVFEERASEPSVSFESLVKKLKKDGKI